MSRKLLFAALLSIGTLAVCHQSNWNNFNWQNFPTRDGRQFRPYYPPPGNRPPANFQNPNVDIQVANADWVCRNQKGDIIILSEDNNPQPNAGNNYNNNNGDNNNWQYKPQQQTTPNYAIFNLPTSSAPPTKEPPKSNGEGLIDIRFGNR